MKIRQSEVTCCALTLSSFTHLMLIFDLMMMDLVLSSTDGGQVAVGQLIVVMGRADVEDRADVGEGQVVAGQQVAVDLEGNRRKSVRVKSHVALSLSLHSLTSC